MLLIWMVVCLAANVLSRPVSHSKHKSHHTMPASRNATDSHGSKRGYDIDCTETRCNWGNDEPCAGPLHNHAALLNSQDAHTTPFIDHCCERGAFQYTECINGHEFPAVLQQQNPQPVHATVVTKPHDTTGCHPHRGCGYHHNNHEANHVVHGIHDETAMYNENFHRIDDNVGHHDDTAYHNAGYHDKLGYHDYNGYHNNVGYHGTEAYHQYPENTASHDNTVYHDNTGYHDNVGYHGNTGYHDKVIVHGDRAYHDNAALSLNAYDSQRHHGAFDSVAYPEHVVGAPVHTVTPKNGTNDYAGVAAMLTNVPATVPAVSHQDATVQSWPVQAHGNTLGVHGAPAREDVVDSLNNVNVAVAPAAGTHMYNIANTLPQLASGHQVVNSHQVAAGQVPLAHTNMGVTDTDVIAAHQQHALPAATPTSGPVTLSGHISIGAPGNATITDTEVTDVDDEPVTAVPMGLNVANNVPVSTTGHGTYANSPYAVANTEVSGVAPAPANTYTGQEAPATAASVGLNQANNVPLQTTSHGAFANSPYAVANTEVSGVVANPVAAAPVDLNAANHVPVQTAPESHLQAAANTYTGHEATVHTPFSVTDRELSNVDTGTVANAPVDLNAAQHVPVQTTSVAHPPQAVTHTYPEQEATGIEAHPVTGVQHDNGQLVSGHLGDRNVENVNLNCGQTTITLEKATIIKEGLDPKNLDSLLTRFCSQPASPSPHTVSTVATTAARVPVTNHENTEVYVPAHDNTVVDATSVEGKPEDIAVEGKADGNSYLTHHDNATVTDVDDNPDDEEPTAAERNSANLVLSSANAVEPVAAVHGTKTHHGLVHHAVHAPTHHRPEVVPVHNDEEPIAEEELTDSVNAFKKAKNSEARGHATQKKHKLLKRIPST